MLDGDWTAVRITGLWLVGWLAGLIAIGRRIVTGDEAIWMNFLRCCCWGGEVWTSSLISVEENF